MQKIRFTKKSLLSTVALLFILLAVPFTVFFSQRQQDFRQHAAPSTEWQQTFTDVSPSAPYYTALSCLNGQYKVVKGYTPDNCTSMGKTYPCFGGERLMNRAYTASFISRFHVEANTTGTDLWSFVTPATPTYKDVPTTYEHYTDIETGRQYGFFSANPYGDQTFRPEDNWVYGFQGINRSEYNLSQTLPPITRGDFIKALYDYGMARGLLPACATPTVAPTAVPSPDACAQATGRPNNCICTQDSQCQSTYCGTTSNSSATKYCTTPPASNNPKGFLDSVTNGQALGWTCDADNYSQALSVQLYIDGIAGSTAPVFTQLANTTREAAVGAQCGGNVNHGFIWNIPDQFKDGKQHTVNAYAVNIGSGQNTFLGSQTFTISSTTQCKTRTTYAENPATGECKLFNTFCDVPPGWIAVNSCPATTMLNLNIGLDGIGISGDNVNPTANSLSNKSPKTLTRTATVLIFDDLNNQVVQKSATVTYASTSGTFTGGIDLGTIATGKYNIKVTVNHHLRRLIPGIQTITSGQAKAVPYIHVVAGDVTGDNVIDIRDYNILRDAYCGLGTPEMCQAKYKAEADLNDDGKVDLDDLNLFQREILTQNGD